MAEAEKKVKVTERASEGAWAVVDDDGQVLALERSEVRAWRIAGPLKATIVRWGFGKTRIEVLGAGR